MNIFIVFFLTGIWHGAAFTFIAWGLWHGLFNLAERVIRQFKKKHEIQPAKGAAAVAASVWGHVYTLLVVIIGWVFFRASGLTEGVKYALSLFGLYNEAAASHLTLRYYMDNWTLCVLIIGLVMATPLPKLVLTRVTQKLPAPVCDIVCNLTLLAAMLLCVLQVASNTYSAFIYFQF